jgi:HKD family nuclease
MLPDPGPAVHPSMMDLEKIKMQKSIYDNQEQLFRTQPKVFHQNMQKHGTFQMTSVFSSMKYNRNMFQEYFYKIQTQFSQKIPLGVDFTQEENYNALFARLTENTGNEYEVMNSHRERQSE